MCAFYWCYPGWLFFKIVVVNDTMILGWMYTINICSATLNIKKFVSIWFDVVILVITTLFCFGEIFSSFFILFIFAHKKTVLSSRAITKSQYFELFLYCVCWIEELSKGIFVKAWLWSTRVLLILIPFVLPHDWVPRDTQFLES